MSDFRDDEFQKDEVTYNEGSENVGFDEVVFDEYDGTYHSTTSNQASFQKKPKKKKKKVSMSKVAKFAGAAVAFGLIAGLVMQGVMYGFSTAGIGNGGTQLATTQTVSSTSDSSSSSDLSTVSENVMPSIVSITGIFESTSQGFFGQQQSSETEGVGSGIIVGKKSGYLYIATNNHVVEDAKSISVGFVDGKSVSATVKGTDTDADLAVVAVKLSDMKASTLKEIKVITLGKSSSLKVGEQAIAIGNALGYGQSVTGGYISATEREVQLTDNTMTLIQTDAAINPGNSGGALLNSKGELIGINTVKYSSTDVEGMGYAIPIDTAKPIINDLINEEAIDESEQAYLGISGQTISSDTAASYDMPTGVYVNQVTSDSPAKLAGIASGDVITKFNGSDVSSIEGLQNKISKLKAGTKVKVVVQRKNQEGTDYEKHTYTVTLGKKSEASTTESTTESTQSNSYNYDSNSGATSNSYSSNY